MGKIDEMIESVHRHAYSGVLLEQLEQLRPYVELAEEFIDMKLFATYPQPPEYKGELIIRNQIYLGKLHELSLQIYQQIRGERNEQN